MIRYLKSLYFIFVPDKIAETCREKEFSFQSTVFNFEKFHCETFTSIRRKSESQSQQNRE